MNILYVYKTNNIHLWMQIVSEIRKTMESLGFIEVETPVLQVCFFALTMFRVPQYWSFLLISGNI